MDEKYKKRFYSKTSYFSFIKKLHPNRILRKNEDLLIVEYYRNTKANRLKYNFIDTIF